MIGSTMPLAERLGAHPVYRATALLRQALLNSAATAPDPAEIWEDRPFHVDSALIDVAPGPASVTFPTSLAALLGVTPGNDQSASCQSPVTQSHDGSAADAPIDASEGEAMLDHTTQAQLHGLVEAFYRRQRQVSLLVAGSIAMAFLLTLGGLILLFSLTGSEPAERDNAAPQDGASAARHAGLVSPLLQPTLAEADKPTKDAPLLIRVKADGDAQGLAPAPTSPQVILTTPKRPLALAPLLPIGSARYLLLQGLPEEAELSAGRRTGRGTWMVKGEDVPSLTLTLGGGANGDYPIDVYLLDSGNGPQARRRLVLRVDQSPQIYTAGLGLGWPTSPGATRLETPAAGTAANEADTLRGQAQQLLDEGDIVAARPFLARLAEHGQVEAAYELALTYDQEVLAKAGINGVDGDAETARAWYERAAQAGHAKAAQRLQSLTLR